MSRSGLGMVATLRRSRCAAGRSRVWPSRKRSRSASWVEVINASIIVIASITTTYCQYVILWLLVLLLLSVNLMIIIFHASRRTWLLWNEAWSPSESWITSWRTAASLGGAPKSFRSARTCDFRQLGAHWHETRSSSHGLPEACSSEHMEDFTKAPNVLRAPFRCLLLS